MARVICYDPTGKNCNCKYCRENKRKAHLKEWVNGKIEQGKKDGIIKEEITKRK